MNSSMRAVVSVFGVLRAFLVAVLPAMAAGGEPVQESVSGEGVQLEITETAPEPGGPVAAPAPRAAGSGRCECRVCAARRGSAWSRYKSRKQEQYWGYPEYFEEVSFGGLSADLMRPQVLRGELARMTLYDCDFVPGTARLNPRGFQRLRQLAGRAAITGQTITVESTGKGVDDFRYQTVLAIATAAHLNPAQVVSGQPIAGGLDGEEALIHRQTGLDNARDYGVRQFEFGSGSGGFGTSGFGTSGSGVSSGGR
ncbi:MAG: hypothetical protein ACKO2P_15375 [Planctomycetota bacterium]